MDSPNPFATPDAGAVSTTSTDFFPKVEYSAMKTPETFANKVTAEVVADARANFKLGFHFWDKDLAARVAIDKFSFVVLEVYSKISGSREVANKQYVNYYSNSIKDSRTEEFVIWEQGQKKPFMRGFYQGKKGDTDFAKLVKDGQAVRIPDGAGYHQHFIIYWIEGERILDLKLTTMVSREIKEAIARAELSANRKVKAEKVNLFELATKSLWGFTVQKFRRTEKEGTDYKSGEMFLLPYLACGVVIGEGENSNPELYQTCRDLQGQIRANYLAGIERRKQFGDSEPAQSDAPPVSNDGSFPTEEQAPPNRAGYNPPPAYQDNPVYSAPPPPEAGDDLPF